MTRRSAAVVLTLLAAGLGCSETGAPSESGGVRLLLQFASVLSGETLDIQPSYRRTDQSTVQLDAQHLALEAGASANLTVQVDITACLGDPAREGVGAGCPLRLLLTLRDAGGEVLDIAQIGPLDAVPGTAVEPPAVTLRHLETITLTAASQTITMGVPATVTAQVTDRANTQVQGLTLAWASDNPAVATVSQSGLVTPVSPGQTTIRATISGRPTGPQGSLAITVEFSNTAIIGPAGGTILSANGRLTLTIPPGAIAAPTTVSIQPFIPGLGSDRPVLGGLYQIFPSGLQLLQPATATIGYGLADIQGGVRNEPTLRLFFVPAGDSTFRIVASSSVNTSARQVTGPISELGIVGAGVAVLGVRSLAVGDSHSCAALTTGQGLCWGSGLSGELGQGILDGSPDPVRVTGSQDFLTMAAGRAFSCGLTTGGQVWCWGANQTGQLGNGTTTQSLVPVQVTLPPIAALEASYDHACAADQAQRVWCWGNNFRGQLGVTVAGVCAGQPCSLLPVQLPANITAVSLTTGLQNTCAMTPSFQGCWGSNLQGSLGLPLATPSSQAAVPPPAGAPGVFVQLAPGGIHSCGLLANGTGWCWGDQQTGRLGNGSIAGAPLLTSQAIVGGLQFAMIDAAGANSFPVPVCGVTTAGAGYCWGSNSRGQIGNPAGPFVAICGSFGPCTGNPVPVAGGLLFREIHGGSNFACGLTTGSALIWCWGANNNGELGVGDHTDSPTPKRIP